MLHLQEVKTEFVALPTHLPGCVHSAVHKNKVTAIHRKKWHEASPCNGTKGQSAAKAPVNKYAPRIDLYKLLHHAGAEQKKERFGGEGLIKRERDRAHNLCETDKRLRVAINFARARGGVKTHTRNAVAVELDGDVEDGVGYELSEYL